MTVTRKKLIEVAMPLPEINDASAFDKRPGIGPHPKGLHQWWARLPLPAARAVLFASVVDDPSGHPETWSTQEAQNAERERLFGIIRLMLQKKLHEHPEIYAAARAEMLKHCDGDEPTIFDPFAGGGSIPLEASRLGFEAYAADLNPVAVLLNACNLELAPRCSDRPPVNPEARQRIGGAHNWHGTHGLAADVRYYGRLIRDRALTEIGHLYPQVNLPSEYGRSEAGVIAWIWARTVASPDPALRGTHVPLISTFWLSSKAGGEAWLNPVVDRTQGTWRFEVRTGDPADRAAVKAGTKVGRAQFRCLLTGVPIGEAHIKQEGRAGRLGTRLVAIVADKGRGRLYLPASDEHEAVARSALPRWQPEQEVKYDPIAVKTPLWGLSTFADHFTPRQLAALATLSDLVRTVREDVHRDAVKAGLTSGESDAYSRTVTTFLALALDRSADSNNSLCRWDQSPAGQRVKNLFGRQVVPMLWDFAEANILGEKSVSWISSVDITAEAVESLAPSSVDRTGTARQIDAASGVNGLQNLLVSTDPPYYDNIGYAALSDFFYVWLRQTVGDLYPDLFSTVLTPKAPELTASPERFEGDKEKAKQHFESGFRTSFSALRERMDPRFPLTVYYAFKQDDEEEEEADGENGGRVDRTTGWETLLESLIGSGFQITATWPVRASQKWRMLAMGTNALASYIVLACRSRPHDAPPVTRAEFLQELSAAVRRALPLLIEGQIPPVDLAQASLGPGMAVYSKYSQVLRQDGKPVTVREALQDINNAISAYRVERTNSFDSTTRFCTDFYDQFGFATTEFDHATVLARAQNVGINTLEDQHLLVAEKGSAWLVPMRAYPTGLSGLERAFGGSAWEACMRLVATLQEEGEAASAALARELGDGLSVRARELAIWLYTIADARKRSQDAVAFGELEASWPEIQRLMASLDRGQQGRFA